MNQQQTTTSETPSLTRRELEAVRRLALERGVTGGLLKRIDENRELLELLQRESPQLLKSNPWMVGWLQANDDFFVELAQLLKVHSRDIGFPRAWPGSDSIKDFSQSKTPRHANKLRQPRRELREKLCAESFLLWLGESLLSGALPFNQHGAAVHFTSEGLALVSPKIFKLFLNIDNDPLVTFDMVKVLQADLRRFGNITRNGDRDLFVYELIHTGALLHCIVLPYPERYLSPRPAVNAALRLFGSDGHESVSRETVMGKTMLGPSTPRPRSTPEPKFRACGAKARPDADAFFFWVQQGLVTGDLSYNEPHSPIHFTAEGMALVWPRIFKLYLAANSYQGALKPRQQPLYALQKDLLRGRYVVTNSNGGIFSYKLRGLNGSFRKIIRTYIVPNPKAFIQPVPENSSLLVLIDAVAFQLLADTSLIVMQGLEQATPTSYPQPAAAAT